MTTQKPISETLKIAVPNTNVELTGEDALRFALGDRAIDRFIAVVLAIAFGLVMVGCGGGSGGVIPVAHAATTPTGPGLSLDEVAVQLSSGQRFAFEGHMLPLAPGAVQQPCGVVTAPVWQYSSNVSNCAEMDINFTGPVTLTGVSGMMECGAGADFGYECTAELQDRDTGLVLWGDGFKARQWVSRQSFSNPVNLTVQGHLALIIYMFQCNDGSNLCP